MNFLTCGMIRNSDDNSAHICAFCRKRFHLKASHSLLQCPTCKDVYHLQCMLDFIRKSSNDNISCPCCREIVPVETVDEYISTETLEKEWYFDFHQDDNDCDEDSGEEDESAYDSGDSDEDSSEEDESADDSIEESEEDEQ